MRHHRFFVSLLSISVICLPVLVLAADLPNPIGSPSMTVKDLIVNVTRALIGLTAIGATFMFVYGGIMMIISAGNAEQIKRSKEVLKWATVGLVLIFLSGAILRYVYTILGAK